jgi:hypothetical protein
MGQKVSTKPVDKSAQDAAKLKLYIFMLKLLHPERGIIHVSFTSF